MSQVTLLAADRPLPLYDPGVRRVKIVQVNDLPPHPQFRWKTPFTIRGEEDGFSVQPNSYYRRSVDMLGLTIKPHQYELNLDATEQDAALLRDYLSQNCKTGEQVELWNLWVGDVDVRAFHLEGHLSDLDRDTLEQLFEKDQTCMTITI